MARDPGSLWSPLAENGQQGDFPKDKFIVHSTGDRGSALAIYNYFNRANIVVESTFVVGLGPEDPTRQLMDSSQLADANMAANKSGISVEVVGTGDDDYTDWQVQEVIRLGTWARGAHAIPPQIIPAPTGAGFGWHVMFGAPGPWTDRAKVCPGNLRIQRLQEHVFPEIFGHTVPVVHPPVPSGPGKPALPAWPLKRGQYFGHKNGPAASVGGFYGPLASIKTIQQLLIYLGCVPQIDPSRWATSTWADGVWEDETSLACRRWFARYRPGQPFTDRIYRDDYTVLSRL